MGSMEGEAEESGVGTTAVILRKPTQAAPRRASVFIGNQFFILDGDDGGPTRVHQHSQESHLRAGDLALTRLLTRSEPALVCEVLIRAVWSHSATESGVNE
jgi:hypothetical protein